MGKLDSLVTSTDLVLTITKNLRQIGVVGKFVEFYGPGVAFLSIADRATISNMCPEFGGTVGYFAVDSNAIEYLRQTSEYKKDLKQCWKSHDFAFLDRSEEKIKIVEEYLKASKQFRYYDDESQDPVFSKVRKFSQNS